VLLRQDAKTSRERVHDQTANRVARLACTVYLNHEWNAAFSVHEITNYLPPIAGLKRKCAVPPPPTGDYVISTSHAHPNRCCRSSGRRLTIVKCGRPPGLLKHDRTTKHRNRTLEFLCLNIGTSDIGRFTRIGRSLLQTWWKLSPRGAHHVTHFLGQ